MGFPLHKSCISPGLLFCQLNTMKREKHMGTEGRTKGMVIIMGHEI